MSHWKTTPCGFISHQQCNFFFCDDYVPFEIFTQRFNSCLFKKSQWFTRYKMVKQQPKCIKILSSCHVLLTYFPDIFMCALYNHICHKNGKSDAYNGITAHNNNIKPTQLNDLLNYLLMIVTEDKKDILSRYKDNSYWL